MMQAMIIWSVYSSQFQILLGLIVEAGILAVIIVALAAIAFPTRRPDLYRASPANVSVLGIPVLYITGVLSIIIFLVMLVISFQFPGLVMGGNPDNWWWIVAFFAAMIVIGLAIYYVPRFLRAREGVDVSLVYRELPPE